MPDSAPPPGTKRRAARRGARGPDARTLALVALFALLVVGPSTVGRELMPPDEPRFALVASEMYERADPVVPTRHGEPYLDKPPLLFWLASAAFALTGGPGEIAARLPSLAASVLVVLFAAALGARHAGPRAGLLTGAVVATSSLFLLRAGWVVTDTLLAAAVLGCVDALDRARADPGRSAWGAVGALWLSAGLLAKGPVAAFFVALATLASFAAPAPRLSLRPLVRPLPLALLATTLLPWPVALALRSGDPGALLGAWFHQTAVRYVDSWDNLEPWWYYGEALLIGLLPWSVLLAALVDGGVRRALARAPRVRWMLAWGALAALVLSVPAGKRGVYLLPVLPAFAVAVAAILEARPGRAARRLVAAAAALAALPLAAIAAAFAVDAGGLGLLPRGLPPGGALRVGIVALAGTWAAALAGMAAAALARWRALPLGPVGAALALGLSAPFVTGPALDAAQGARRAAAEIATLAPRGEPVGACRTKRELLDWYLDRPLVPLDDAAAVLRFLEHGRGVVVCRDAQQPPAGSLPPGVVPAGRVRIGRLVLDVLAPARTPPSSAVRPAPD